MGVAKVNGIVQVSRWNKFLFGCVCTLAVGEFSLTIISHSLVLRLALAHSIVILALCSRTLIETKVYFRTFRSVWTLICGTALYGLCITNAIHAFQMLTHRHDSGVHVPMVLLACAVSDILLKEVLLCESSSTNGGFGSLTHSKSEKWGDRVITFCFFASPGISMLLISLMRILLPTEWLVLWVDPGLTAALCFFLCALVTRKMKKLLFALILTSPQKLSVLLLKQSFVEKFPDLKCHHLHIWEEDRLILVTVHIDVLWSSVNLPSNAQMKDFLHQIASFFHSFGVDQVTLQPEIRQLEVVPRNGLTECLYDCRKDHCMELRCCVKKAAAKETFVHFNYHDSYVSTQSK